MKNSDCYVVVGTGSIAKRHISNLKQLFPNALIACAPSSNESSSVHQIEADKIFRDIIRVSYSTAKHVNQVKDV